MVSRRKPRKTHSMYPTLHDDVLAALESDDLYFSFFPSDTDNGLCQSYDTNVMGFFICNNDACTGRKWSSKKIAITIRLYSEDAYNTRVYHQRCKQCNSLSKPHLDSSYVDRVVYRLKKWSGVTVEKPNYFRKKGTTPHLESLCEGCKAGHCTEGF